MEYGIRCGGCGQTVPEGIGHTCTREPPYSETTTKFLIKQYPIADSPCPSCAALLARCEAAEKEVGRLREAVEWALDNVPTYYNLTAVNNWAGELRRRAAG